MSRLERALLTSVMVITTGLAGCAADVQPQAEDDGAAEAAATDEQVVADVEEATSQLLKDWGGDGDYHDGGDPHEPCDHDGGDCKGDDGHDEPCKDDHDRDRRKPHKVCFFKTIMTGFEEVPMRRTFAFGAAVFKYDSKERKLDYWLFVANIRNVVAAHLHLGAKGVNGPVVAFLAGPFPPGGGFFTGQLASGSIGRDDLLGPLEGEKVKTLVEAIAAGDIYVNVHTDDGVAPANTGRGDFAAGEIRGQIKKLGCKIIEKEHDCKDGRGCDGDHHDDDCKHGDCDHDCKHDDCDHDCKHDDCDHDCKPDHGDCKHDDCKDHHDCPNGDHDGCKDEHHDCPHDGHDPHDGGYPPM